MDNLDLDRIIAYFKNEKSTIADLLRLFVLYMGITRRSKFFAELKDAIN